MLSLIFRLHRGVSEESLYLPLHQAFGILFYKAVAVKHKEDLSHTVKHVTYPRITFIVVFCLRRKRDLLLPGGM